MGIFLRDLPDYTQPPLLSTYLPWFPTTLKSYCTTSSRPFTYLQHQNVSGSLPSSGCRHSVRSHILVEGLTDHSTDDNHVLGGQPKREVAGDVAKFLAFEEANVESFSLS